MEIILQYYVFLMSSYVPAFVDELWLAVARYALHKENELCTLRSQPTLHYPLLYINYRIYGRHLAARVLIHKMLQ
jgi:hypothetical protein